MAEGSPAELQRRHSLITVRPAPIGVNDPTGGSGNLYSRPTAASRSALVLEVLGVDLIEELPELLDLGLILVGHLDA
jgi:hypothetical protein